MVLAGLEEAVDPGFGDDGIGGGQRLADAQELSEGDRRGGRPLDGGGESVELGPDPVRAGHPRPHHRPRCLADEHVEAQTRPGGGPSPTATPTSTTGVCRKRPAKRLTASHGRGVVVEGNRQQRTAGQRSGGGVVEAVGHQNQSVGGGEDRGHGCTSLPPTQV